MTEKIYVLDTSVILYDHEAIEHFAKNDVAIPIQVLEELDNFKKGNEFKNFGAREFIRFIDEISQEQLLQDWIPINGPDKGNFRVVADGSPKSGQTGLADAEKIFGENKADNKILNAAIVLQKAEPNKKVILVTKDIALRLKARSLEVTAEDYETGRIRDISELYKGKDIVEGVSSTVIDELCKNGSVNYRELFDVEPVINQYFILRNGKKSALGTYTGVDEQVALVGKESVYGVTPRNAEQIFAIHALMNPTVKLVTLQGVAGTGKTLLALAAALEQRKKFRQIYVARPVVPLGNKDLGFLPGDVASKLDPYMQPLWDNLKFIRSQFDDKSSNHRVIEDMVAKEKIEIAPLAYIRGRSISNVYFVIDEAQNLTPHEVKTIITRAGENTKLIFTGDIRQIDSPYLDSQSNGLSHLIDCLKDNPLFAHVTLEKGERSELANLANALL